MKSKIIVSLLFLVLFVYAGSASAWTEGTNNSFFGVGAGNVTMTGSSNSFFGAFAGNNNLSGSNNTFVGRLVGTANTTGYSNTFNGYLTGRENTTGWGNTFIGEGAGYVNSIGIKNVFLGYRAGYTSTGSNNVFLGNYAGYSETGSNKLYIGNSGTSSPLIYGDFSLNTLTINGYLTAISLSGIGSGLTSLSGSNISSGTVADARIASTIARDSEIMTTVLANDGSASGLDADLLDGLDSTAFAQWSAGITISTANSYFGINAGTGSGNYNAFFGSNAGDVNTGNYNTFNGYQAGFSNTTGSFNTFYGHAAGRNHSTGNYNTFYGNEAGINNTTGEGNVFLGNHSGYNESGSNKLYIENSNISTPLIYGEFDNDLIRINGALDVTGTLSITGDINTPASYQVGGTQVLKANSDNTYIGKDAGLNSVSGAGNVFVGYQAGLNETGNYKLYISNSSTATPLIYGEFNNGFVDINGDLYVSGNTYVDSDATLKDEIQPITSALNKINEIEGVTYKWKNRGLNSDTTHFGVIAQQVEAVLPELVSTGQDEKKSVAYMELIPVMIEAMKEQQKIISELKEENRVMSNKMTELLAEIKTNGILAMTDID